eukprot:4048637-Alexandrium_andersonii.AAC.1
MRPGCMPFGMPGGSPNGTLGSFGAFAMTRPSLGLRMRRGSPGPTRPLPSCFAARTGATM